MEVLIGHLFCEAISGLEQHVLGKMDGLFSCWTQNKNNNNNKTERLCSDNV